MLPPPHSTPPRPTPQKVENISRHVRNWLKKGKVGKMLMSGKYLTKFNKDIKEIDKLLNMFSVAVGVDTNLAVRELTKSAEKRNRRESASKMRNDILFDLEINVKDYDYKSDKPFANGSTADMYLINYNGHEMAAKVFNLRMLTTMQRVKKLREFKKVRKIERRTLSKPDSQIGHGQLMAASHLIPYLDNLLQLVAVERRAGVFWCSNHPISCRSSRL